MTTQPDPANFDLSTLGARILYGRICSGLTLEGLADRCFVSVRSVSNWEHNHHLPRRANLIGLAIVLAGPPFRLSEAVHWFETGQGVVPTINQQEHFNVNQPGETDHDL